MIVSTGDRRTEIHMKSNEPWLIVRLAGVVSKICTQQQKGSNKVSTPWPRGELPEEPRGEGQKQQQEQEKETKRKLNQECLLPH